MTAAGTIGTTISPSTPTGNPMPACFEDRHHPDAAASPYALPPVRQMRVHVVDEVLGPQQVGLVGARSAAADVDAADRAVAATAPPWCRSATRAAPRSRGRR